MFRLERGQLLFIRPGRPPIGVHWTLALGLAVLSRLTFDLWFCVGYLTILLVHELGHALLVKAFHLQTEGILLHGLGGECLFSGRVTQRKRSIIAWGGVVAQAALLAMALLTGMVVAPEGGWSRLHATLTVTNALLIGLNLLPLPGFDGFHAWRLVSGDPKRPHDGPSASYGERDNVVRFPGERVVRTTSEDSGQALSDVKAQILEITERVNRENKERPTGDT